MMADLFRDGMFRAHSGEHLQWKIECDEISTAEWELFAKIVAARIFFEAVEGVPRGGHWFAQALKPYCGHGGGLLIVDDVLTTGASMEQQRDDRDAKGVVLFSRVVPPNWIFPIWSLSI